MKIFLYAVIYEHGNGKSFGSNINFAPDLNTSLDLFKSAYEGIVQYEVREVTDFILENIKGLKNG